MINNKRGFVQLLGLLLSPLMLTILGVLFILIMLSVFGIALFVTTNVFTIVGVFLVIVGAIGLLKGFAPNVGFILIGVGIGLILLPIVSEKVAGITLASLLP